MQVPEYPCDTPEKGFQCHPDLTHSWGQYSPFFSTPSQVPWETPKTCKITFAQILARHGARYPTSKASENYNATIEHIQRVSNNLVGEFAFLSNYSYDLKSDELTDFGRREMISLGISFYKRYRDLAAKDEIFVRASGSDRVVESAELFLTGYHHVEATDASSTTKGNDAVDSPQIFDPGHQILVIPEGPSSNNT